MPAATGRRKTTRTTKSKAKTARKPTHVESVPQGKPVGYEVIGLILILLGVTLMLATRLQGAVPTALLHSVQWLFGTYGSWGIAGALILLGVTLLVHLSQVELSSTSLGVAIIFVVSISLLQLNQNPVWNPHQFAKDPGGLFGGAIAGGFHLVMGQLAWLPLVVAGLCGIALMTDKPLWMIFAYPVKVVYLKAVRPVVRSVRIRKEAELAAKVAELKEEELRSRSHPNFDLDLGLGFQEDDIMPEAKPAAAPPARKQQQKIEEPAPAPAPAAIPEPEPIPVPKPVREPEPEPVSAKAPELAALDDITPIDEDDEPTPRVTGVPSKDDPEQLQFADDAVAHPSNRPYTLPPLDLLSLSPKAGKQKKDDTQEKISSLEETLSSFGIDAKVVGVERGPRVTRFELVPPPGIRINRITNLADNIALSLAALDVRVEAPVPGKGVVGIEVPNKESVIVDLREIVDSDPFIKGKSPLTVALGRDIAGHPRCADLTRMPHLLIAGATNSGKSVCINCLICSILMRATPQQVKFLMVDPKRVELSLFQSIPHLIAPVAYDAKHAAGLLRWAIREMEQRYEMFAEKGVRNIVGFNEHSRLDGLEELPYIVIIIDELADLMMQAAAEFEASICRLAQLARATGIHLVVATQRPSVNVITGTIKANIPSRIAFAVASQVD
ncbi:MAG TPA: DNA translocase FtsK, partial [Armatimonadota bacterium]|nr:DNA translocase FtsK [Armatimonadota bacterium]